MNKPLFFLLLSVIFFYGCETYELDPFDPRLPEYSSEGLDIAGCYFNGGIWARFCEPPTSFDYDCVSLVIKYDSLRNESRIGFGGIIYRDALGNQLNRPVSISFLIKERIDSYSSLKNLGERLQLDGNVAYPEITFFEDGEAIVQDCASGFRSVGNLYFHDVYLRQHENSSSPTMVMAGTFGFHLKSDCWVFEVEQGRFDFDDIFFFPETF